MKKWVMHITNKWEIYSRDEQVLFWILQVWLHKVKIMFLFFAFTFAGLRKAIESEYWEVY